MIQQIIQQEQSVPLNIEQQRQNALQKAYKTFQQLYSNQSITSEQITGFIDFIVQFPVEIARDQNLFLQTVQIMKSLEQVGYEGSEKHTAMLNDLIVVCETYRNNDFQQSPDLLAQAKIQQTEISLNRILQEQINKLNQMEARLNDIPDKIDSIDIRNKGVLERYKQQIQKVNEQRSILSEEKKQLQNKVSRYQRQNQEIQQKYGSLDQISKKVQSQLQQKVDALIKQRETSDKQYQQYTKQWKQKYASLEQISQKMKNDLQSKVNELIRQQGISEKKYLDRINERDIMLQTKTHLLREQETANAIYERERNSLASDMNVLKEELNNQKAKFKSQRQALLSAKEMIKQLENKYTITIKGNTSLQSQLNATKNKLYTTQGLVRIYQNDLKSQQDLEAKMTKKFNQKDVTINTLKRDRDSLQNQLSKLKEQNKQSSQMIQQLRLNIKKLERVLGDLEEGSKIQMGSLKKEMEARNEQFYNLKKELEARYEQSQRQNKESQIRNNEAIKEKQSAIEQVRKMSISKKELEARNEQLQRQNKQNQIKNNIAIKEKQSAIEQVRKMKQQNQMLRKQLETSNQRQTNMSGQIESLKKRNQYLGKVVKEKSDYVRKISLLTKKTILLQNKVHDMNYKIYKFMFQNLFQIINKNQSAAQLLLGASNNALDHLSNVAAQLEIIPDNISAVLDETINSKQLHSDAADYLRDFEGLIDQQQNRIQQLIQDTHAAEEAIRQVMQNPPEMITAAHQQVVENTINLINVLQVEIRSEATQIQHKAQQLAQHCHSNSVINSIVEAVIEGQKSFVENSQLVENATQYFDVQNTKQLFDRGKSIFNSAKGNYGFGGNLSDSAKDALYRVLYR